jgi:hypothetical protein
VTVTVSTKVPSKVQQIAKKSKKSQKIEEKDQKRPKKVQNIYFFPKSPQNSLEKSRERLFPAES